MRPQTASKHGSAPHEVAGLTAPARSAKCGSAKDSIKTSSASHEVVDLTAPGEVSEVRLGHRQRQKRHRVTRSRPRLEPLYACKAALRKIKST